MTENDGTIVRVLVPGRRGAVTAIGVTLAFVAVGCSMGTSFERSLKEAMETEPSSIFLPQGPESGSPISDWTTVSIVCPYTDPDQLGERVAGALNNVLTTDDSVQWLVFQDDAEAQRVKIARDSIDFCGGTGLDSTPLAAAVEWRAQQVDGVWNLSPH